MVELVLRMDPDMPPAQTLHKAVQEAAARRSESVLCSELTHRWSFAERRRGWAATRPANEGPAPDRELPVAARAGTRKGGVATGLVGSNENDYS